MSDTMLAARRGERLRAAFRAEELTGLRLAILATFGLLGLAHYHLRRGRPDRPWLGYVFVALDCGLLAFATLGLGAVLEGPWPPQMTLRNGTVVYFFVFVGLMSLSYRPYLMLWSGVVGALAWSAGVASLAAQPGSVSGFGDAGLPPLESLALHLDPRFVDIGVWLQNVIVLLLMAGILAVAGWRGKRLVQRQAEAERGRANLARYFSPNMVDQLAGTDEALGAVRSQPVAVLFADMVGFTQVSEALPPERVIQLLREFHGRMSRAVFETGGTVDKFIGDAIMATFGTPFTGPADAANAAACARAMVREVSDWNRQRWAQGHLPIQVGIGAHYGPAVLGDIGSERRLEFAVVGDTVNVASHLEGLTRELGVDIAVSDELARQVELEDRDEVLDGFARGQPRQLKNREKPMVVWIWRAE
jgi:adenylate cyclase